MTGRGLDTPYGTAGRGALTWSHFATDGVPSASVTNSMYQPGGTSVGSWGTSTVTERSALVSPSSIERCSTSVVCVTALGRIRRARAIRSGSAVAKVARPAASNASGPSPRTGRRAGSR